MSALSTRATDEGEYSRTVTKCWSLCYPAEANATRLSRQRPRRSSPLSSAPGPDAAASADESDGRTRAAFVRRPKVCHTVAYIQAELAGGKPLGAFSACVAVADQ